MKIGFVTNDYFDAVHSRVRLAKWIEQHKGADVTVASPQPSSSSSSSSDELWFYKSRGFNMDTLRSVIRFGRDKDVLVYRGIELIVLSLFINHRGKKVNYLLTGLGNVFVYEGRFKNTASFVSICFDCL